jgi:hypothetical protein
MLPLLLALAGSCDKSSGPLSAGVPSALIVVAGDQQVGTVGEELNAPLVVRVEDEDGKPVKQQVVNFRVLSGGGSVFAGVALTNAKGEARERWTLGTIPGQDQRVQARAIDAETGEALVFADFEASARAGAPFSIIAAAGNGQTVAAGSKASDSLVAVVRDKYGNPVPEVSVTWSTTTGGQFTPASSITNASGEARTAWAVGSSSPSQQAVAAAGTLTAQFTAALAPGAASQLLLSQPAAGGQVGASFSQQPVVRVADDLGITVPVTGVPVTMTLLGGPTVSGSGTKSTASGVATFGDAGIQGAPGTYTLNFAATVSGSTLSASQTVSLVAGAVSSYAVTPSATSSAVGTTFDVQAQARDVAGNPVSIAGRVITWTRSGNGGTFATATSTTNASGIATNTFTVANTLTATSVVISATDASLVKGSVAVGVTTGSAVKLLFVTQPVDVGYETVMTPITIRVADQFDNVVAPDARTIELSIATGQAGATLGGTTSLPASAGTTTFSTTYIDKPGSGYTLKASASGVAEATSTSFAVTSVATVVSAGLLPAGHFLTALAVGPTALYYTRVSGVYTGQSGGLQAFVHSVGLRGGTTQQLRSMSRVTGGPVRIRLDGTVLRTLTRTVGEYFAPEYFDGGYASFTTTGATTGGVAINRMTGQDVEFDGTETYLPGQGAIFPVTSNPMQSTLLGSGGSKAMLYADGYIYFSSGTWVKRIPRPSGGTATTLVASGSATSDTSSRQIAFVPGAPATVYFVGTGGTIRSIPATAVNGTATTVVSGLSANVHHLIPDGSWMYFIDNGSVKRFQISNSSVVETFAANQGALDLAIDATTVYWVGAGGLKKAPK